MSERSPTQHPRAVPTSLKPASHGSPSKSGAALCFPSLPRPARSCASRLHHGHPRMGGGRPLPGRADGPGDRAGGDNPARSRDPASARSRAPAMNTQIERDASLAKLREQVRPGSTICVLLRRKNKLGTCRWLEFYHVHDGELKRITWDVALATRRVLPPGRCTQSYRRGIGCWIGERA